jgi:hypothetical protein
MAARIAIIGGGVAGASVAIYLARLGLNITLFERESSLVSGPPMCHLHAGGNLYPDISNEQCKKLLIQSIELMRFYPHAIDYRPTLIAYPKRNKDAISKLLPRLKMLQKEYELLIKTNKKNAQLASVKEYFKCYFDDDIQRVLKTTTPQQHPNTFDAWLYNALQEIELSKLQRPLIMVQEYGLNLFRIAASAEILLRELPNVTLTLESEVKSIKEHENGWCIHGENFDYLINAAGFRSGFIDDMAGFKRKRFVEFKAAYVTQWRKSKQLFPEIIFQGERGTPNGMGQFTPYPDGYYQLHGMTEKITLYKNGLVPSCTLSAQPKLSNEFIQKIDASWQWHEVEQRTGAAIEHIGYFMPNFKSAKVAAKPLYGAQQIPGEDATLRASEVSFEPQNYARCETVKASSVLTMARDIAQDLKRKGMLETKEPENLIDQSNIDEFQIDTLAKKLACERGYPSSMGGITSKKPSSA